MKPVTKEMKLESVVVAKILFDAEEKLRCVSEHAADIALTLGAAYANAFYFENKTSQLFLIALTLLVDAETDNIKVSENTQPELIAVRDYINWVEGKNDTIP